MKPIASKSLKIIEYCKAHPQAKAKDVAARFKMSLPRTYALRKRALNELIIPEMVPMPPVPVITMVDEVLDQRAVDYGAFKDGAALMQGIKRLMAEHAQKHGKTFADDQWEALEMIVHKIGRIVNGNADKVDHWTDIAGYAKLVADRLEGRVR